MAPGNPPPQPSATSGRFQIGAARGYVSRDVAVLAPLATVQRRDRVPSHKELAAMLPVLAAPGRLYA